MSYFEMATEQLELNLQPNGSTTEWTPEREEILRDIYLKGSRMWVASQLNEKTGSDFSEKAIIGKIARLKLINPPAVWTDERIALLCELWPEGSAAWVADEINARTGSSLERNAIIGKGRRLNLPAKAIRKPHSENLKPKAPRSRTVLKIAPEVISGPPEPDEPDMKPMGYREEWPNDRCRWPVGDPKSSDFYYCGAVGCDVIGGHPWCSFHKRLAYSPTRNAA